MRRLSSTRCSSAKAGDDTTLTRFIKGTARPENVRPAYLKATANSAFVKQGRTKFTGRVMHPDDMTNILSSGHNNVKIGRDIRKGWYSGYWIYTLSLEERKTCPTACKQWIGCYGNSMPFGKRVKHDNPEFLPKLESELNELCKKKFGVMIRLHQLGDFYSSQYLHFWHKMMHRHPNLAVFGYTAHDRDTTIGRLISAMNEEFGRRWRIRFSNSAFPDRGMATTVIAHEADKPTDAFVCPEQTNRVPCCALCGACWSTDKRVAFLEH